MGSSTPCRMIPWSGETRQSAPPHVACITQEIVLTLHCDPDAPRVRCGGRGISGAPLHRGHFPLVCTTLHHRPAPVANAETHPQLPHAGVHKRQPGPPGSPVPKGLRRGGCGPVARRTLPLVVAILKALGREGHVALPQGNVREVVANGEVLQEGLGPLSDSGWRGFRWRGCAGVGSARSKDRVPAAEVLGCSTKGKRSRVPGLGLARGSSLGRRGGGNSFALWVVQAPFLDPLAPSNGALMTEAETSLFHDYSGHKMMIFGPKPRRFWRAPPTLAPLPWAPLFRFGPKLWIRQGHMSRKRCTELWLERERAFGNICNTVSGRDGVSVLLVARLVARCKGRGVGIYTS